MKKPRYDAFLLIIRIQIKALLVQTLNYPGRSMIAEDFNCLSNIEWNLITLRGLACRKVRSATHKTPSGSPRIVGGGDLGW